MFGFKAARAPRRSPVYMKDAQQRWVVHQLRPVHDQERGSAQVDCERPLQPLRNRGEERRCGVGARERILTGPARAVF